MLDWVNLETVAVALAIAYLVLAIKESSLCWYSAFFSTAIYVWIYRDVSLYMESALNLYYMAMAVYGWYQWQRGGDQNTGLSISRWNRSQHIRAVLLIAAATALALWKGKELIAEKMAAAKDKATSAISKAKGMVPGSTPLNPLFVTIVKGVGGAGGGNTPDLPDKSKPDTTKPSTEGGGKASKLGKLANAAKGGIGGLAGGLVLDYAADKARESGNEKTAAGLDIGSSALSGAGMGAMMGSIVPGVGTVIGGAVGGLVGGAYGAYQNWGGLTGKKPMADGGIVDRPTNALVGEAGPEIVSPIKYFENLQTELVTLNKQTVEMLRFLKETAEQTRNTAEATKGLSGDLFKF